MPGPGPDADDDADRLSPAAAFGILGNDTRIAILRALWEAPEPQSYAELRRTVAPDDTGNFNYHVDKVAGHFVRKTEEGYVLRHAGEQIVRAVVSGTITHDPRLEPAEIGERCPYCEQAVEMEYDGEFISVRCTECGGVVGDGFPAGTYMEYAFPPAGLEDRPREAVVDAAHVLYDSKIAPMMKGVCPECAGHVDLEFEVCEDHERDESGLCGACGTRFEVWSIYECRHCRYGRKSAMWFAALNHPAVIAFFNDHGLTETIPFRKLTWDNARFVRNIAETVVETDPYRFRVTIPVGGDQLTVDVDEQLEVLDVEQSRAAPDG